MLRGAMNGRLVLRVAGLCCVASVGQVFSAEAASPQRQKQLTRMLDITWRRGPNLPQGFQDSDGGIVGTTLVTTCGFCSGQKTDAKPGRYPREFLRKTWGCDPADPENGWQRLPDFPGAARQENFSIVVDAVLYCWGGFSYSPPYCYRDGYRLFRRNGNWHWEKLPALPWPVCSSGICTIGSNIYVVGGADYDTERFYTAADRAGKTKRLGARLLVIDTKNIEAGFRRLADLPGTPRWVHATAAVGGKVYVIGGATGSPYCTVVDNWAYDPTADGWTRIRDLPISSGNFPSGRIAFRDRYVLLVGGYQYPKVANPDGTLRGKYGQASRFDDKGAYYNDVFVYDTKTDLFGTADRLPINNNLPMAVVRGDEVFLIGGETGSGIIEGEFYGHHPDLFLVGKIKEPRTK